MYGYKTQPKWERITMRLLFTAKSETGGDNLPPAAKIVLKGTETEDSNTLRQQIAAVTAERDTERQSHARTAQDKKDRENRINELENELKELRRLQGLVKPPTENKTKRNEWVTVLDNDNGEA